jgi:hypothetical protein
MDAGFTEREMIRAEMLQDRGRERRCDLCGTPGASHMHEIVSRGRTVKNAEARDLSYDKRLCSLLCEACHLSIAHTAGIREILLQVNYRRYGYAEVAMAYLMLDAELRTGIDFALPQPMPSTPARPIYKSTQAVPHLFQAPVHRIERHGDEWRGVVFINLRETVVAAPYRVGEPLREAPWIISSDDEGQTT